MALLGGGGGGGSGGVMTLHEVPEFEWRFDTLSVSMAIFRARTYSHILFSPVMIIS